MINKLFFSLLAFNLFLASCHSQRDDKAEAFLKKLLLKEGGIYTLAGDKPMTDILVFIGTENDISLDGLDPKTIENIQYVEDQTFEDWKAWKEYSKNIHSTQFQFVERPCPYDPLYIMYLFVHVGRLRDILTRSKAAFEREIGFEYHVDEVIDDLAKPDSIFWNRTFSNHYLCGLLHGYGEENSIHFIKVDNGEEKPLFSDHPIQSPTPDEFSLPIFAVATNDRQSEKYRVEREQIKQIYKKENFFKKSIELLRK